MALQIKKGYQIKDLNTLKLKDFKAEGFRVYPISTKIVGARAVCMDNGTEKYIALTKKGFDGELNLDTNVIFGNNAEGEKRIYLTNESGAVAIGADW